MRTVLAIGWDVGGWHGKKHGIAAFVAGPRSSPRLLGAPRTLALPEPLGEMSLHQFVRLALGDEAEPSLPYRIVIGIDAPLGFPNPFVALVAGRRITHGFREGMGGNPYAFRETDRHVATRFKWPLSGAFDKLGNNATVAMHYVTAWRADALSIVPFDKPKAQDDVALEVYPALVRTRERGGRPPWYRTLAPDWATRSGDDADAVVCAALALAWACPGKWGLPFLAEPTGQLPQGEGWIYYPEGTGWKDRS